VLAVIISVTGWYFGFGRYTTAPSLVGQAQTQAVAVAQHDGLTIKYAAPVFSQTVKENSVVSQSPSATGKVLKHGVIVLVLSKGPERYSIPNEVGATFAIAQADLVARKMKVLRVDTYSNDLISGLVISVNPKAGTVELPGTVVTVTVSKGRAPITVPNEIGHDYNSANTDLTNLGLVVAETQKTSTSQPAGTVLAQSLPDGSGAVKGQSIILTVSSGPPLVAVPALSNLGYTIDQATQLLQQAGLVVQNVFDFPNGHVINQNPQPGTMVPQGSTVQVWLGP
jgi:serine/threonine-protein kinase